jgi:hypothetical protein
MKCNNYCTHEQHASDTAGSEYRLKRFKRLGERMRTKQWAAGAVVIALSAACAPDTAWQGTITDSAGVTIVANTHQGLWAEGERWTLQEDLRIGVQDGDPDYMFGQIGWLAVGAGSIYVLDAQAQNIKRYAMDGTYMSTFGGPGGGPGELGAGAVFMLLGAGDTLIVPDMQNQRLNFYSADGAALGSSPLLLTEGLPLAWRGTAGGVLAKQVRPLDLPNQPARDSMDAVLALGGDGSVQDTLLRIPSGGTLSFGGATPRIEIYAAEPVWNITNDLDLLYGMNNDYRIGRYHEGRLTRVFTMPFIPRPVSEADRNAVMDFLRTAWRDAGLPPAAIQQAQSLVHFGEWIQAFANLQEGPDGTIWVQHVQSISDLSEEERATFNLLEDSGAPNWDVFEADGRYLGIVTMPARFSPRTFVGDDVYGVWRDDLDVQYVVRMRVMRGVG